MKKVYILFLSLILVAACSKSSDSPGGTPPDPIDKSANLLATGASANDILSNNTFTTLL